MKRKTLPEKIKVTLDTYTRNSDLFVVAVSGGPDSVFLLHVLRQLGHRNVVIAHLNHQFRGRESDLDEAFVNKLAESNKLPFYLKKANIKLLAKKQKQTIEEAGRNARYKFFDELKKKVGAKYIVTAHTRDDQVETLVMNFTRGAGITGLQGMSVLEGVLFRPLLGISKEAILDYLSDHQISYRVDQSNLDPMFTRNKIRLEILPLMKNINPGLGDVLTRQAKVHHAIQEYLMSQVDEWVKQHVTESHFSRSTFLTLPVALQREIIRVMVKQHIGHLQGISFEHIEEVRDTIQSQSSKAQKRIGKTLTLTKNYDIITLLRG